jgi:hypothetical protein
MKSYANERLRNDKYFFLPCLNQVAFMLRPTLSAFFQRYFSLTPGFYEFQTDYYEFQTDIRKIIVEK